MILSHNNVNRYLCVSAGEGLDGYSSRERMGEASVYVCAFEAFEGEIC